jgi:GNAT superfamily N-acetyltransferase
MENTRVTDHSDDHVGTAPERDAARCALGEAASIRAVQFDDLSNVRYLHSQSVKILAGGQLSEDELASARDHIYSHKYVEGLGIAVRRNQFFGVWIGDALAGTGGWSTIDDSSSVARIRSIFVSPLYARLGLAGRLLGYVEGQAVEAGFRTFSVRSIQSSVGFFQRQGYTISSHGSRTLPTDRSLPVTFLRKVV